MVRTFILLILTGWLFTYTASAQIQRSNIFLFDMKQVSDTTFEFSNPRYLTNFNPNGYNNHPAFMSNEELYFSSQLPTENQPDLYVLDLEKQTKTRVTRTAEGEYSPFRAPDYYSFSAIRQEINGRDTLLRLWQFPLDRLTNGRPVFKYITGIGYYYWINSYRIAVFRLGEPNALEIADTGSDRVVDKVATDVGRCIRTLPNGNLLYVQKSDLENWKLVQYNPYNRQRTPLIDVVPGAEDFTVLPNGTILMGRGSRIFKFHPQRDKEWLQIADLRYYEIDDITRLAVSNDYKIAIVAD